MDWPEINVETQTLNLPVFEELGIEVAMLREDLIDSEISGNKWRKLKYNVLKAEEKAVDTLLTFGGAFSNHIAATAAAGNRFGLKTVGVIRGEADDTNPTLQKAKVDGMELYFVSRTDYRDKNSEEFKAHLRDRFGFYHAVPEGGSNFWGVNGCMEILKPEHEKYNYICGACGTGTMMSGIILSLKPHQKALCFPVLKGNFMHDEINNHLLQFLQDEVAVEDYQDQFEVINAYHGGGYAKINAELVDFIQWFKAETNITLDAVYTSKLVRGVIEEAKKGKFQRGDKVLIIHSGGVQGNLGMNTRLGLNLPVS